MKTTLALAPPLIGFYLIRLMGEGESCLEEKNLHVFGPPASSLLSGSGPTCDFFLLIPFHLFLLFCLLLDLVHNSKEKERIMSHQIQAEKIRKDGIIVSPGSSPKTAQSPEKDIKN